MDLMFDNLIPSKQELLTIQKSMTSELVNASSCKESSIPFIRHQAPTHSLVKAGDVFQVMTIGGSIFKTALVKKQQSGFQIYKEQVLSLPLFTTSDIFLSFISRFLDPQITMLGLNFAFPLDPHVRENRLDGILLRGGKEHGFEGMMGKTVGKTIEDYVLSKNKTMISVSVANDAVCLFLSEVDSQNWDTIIAGIIGSGTNYAIGQHSQIINLQSGSFSQFTQTETGNMIDLKSLNPGRGRIEKEISGAYLYQHFNFLAQRFNLTHVPLTSTDELSQLASQKDGKISMLARTILKRSAYFASSQIGGIVKYKELNHSGPFIFVMEGSLFWEGYLYKNHIEEYLEQLGLQDHITFFPKAHHSIKGAIKLLTGPS